MKIIKPITQDQMIASFLLAELVGSSRFAKGSGRALEILKLDRKLITKPDFTSVSDNKKRAKTLGLTRGWPNKYLFSNFPDDVKWYEVEISYDELKNILRLKSSPDLPESHRPVSWVAEQIGQGKKVEKYDHEVVLNIKESIEVGKKLEPIVAVAENMDSKTVLIEGHSRAAAYCLAETQGLGIVLGISKNIKNWEYY